MCNLFKLHIRLFFDMTNAPRLVFGTRFPARLSLAMAQDQYKWTSRFLFGLMKFTILTSLYTIPVTCTLFCDCFALGSRDRLFLNWSRRMTHAHGLILDARFATRLTHPFSLEYEGRTRGIKVGFCPQCFQFRQFGILEQPFVHQRQKRFHPRSHDPI